MRLSASPRSCPAVPLVSRDGRASKPAHFLGFALLLAAGASATAQTPHDFTRIYGPSDRDVPTPAHTAKTASDASALEQLIGFVKASGVTDWKGMTADGTITYAGDQMTYPAHIAILGADRYRLDVEKAEGKQSTILNGEQGVIVSAKGSRVSVPSDVSALGLLAFPKLLSANYPSPTSILTDQATATIGGKTSRRITMDDPDIDPGVNQWHTEDLYFDDADRLVENAAHVHAASGDRALYLMATTYDDYRPAGPGTLLPYKYTESLNGTVQWTLQLNSISFSSLPDPSLFQF